MKQFKNLCQSMAIVLLGAFSLAACSDDEHYDFPGDSYNRVYVSSRPESFKLISTSAFAMFDLNYDLSLSCTRKPSGDIHVTVAMDNSLVDAYNGENGTNYASLPENALNFDKESLIIKAGALGSDTLHVTGTSDLSVLTQLSDENGYLIPLRIVSVDGGDAQPSTNMSVLYLTVSFSSNLINSNASEYDIEGTAVVDQSAWKAMTNGSVTYDPLETLFDNDPSSTTYIALSGSDEPLYLDIDMGKAYTFEAISFYYGYGAWYTYGSLSGGMTISISNDGKEWSNIGQVERTSSYAIFYAPITARYVRLLPVGDGSSYSMEAGIFNVYATN